MNVFAQGIDLMAIMNHVENEEEKEVEEENNVT